MELIKLINVANGYLLHRTRDSVMRQTKRLLPEQINNYRLLKDLQPDKNYPFKIGLYETDNKKEKVVIKTWKGPKNIHYYDLEHQIAVLSVMNSVAKRTKGKLPPEVTDINWPELIEVIRNGDFVAVVTEYIDAVPVQKVKSLESQWNYYKKVEKYLETIGNYLTKKEIDQIKFKDIASFIWLFPFIVLVAIYQNPDKFFLIFKSSFYFLRTIPAFLGYKKYALVHGDLNYGNIMVGNGKIYLLDVEQTNLSYPEFELITTLSTLGNTPGFKQKVTSAILNLSKKDDNLRLRMGGLAINCEIHNLTWNAPEENKRHYIEIINFGQRLIDNHI